MSEERAGFGPESVKVGGRTIHAYHLGDIDVGELVVVDTDGAPWVVGGES